MGKPKQSFISKIFSPMVLVEVLDQGDHQGKKFVFTNGCFDLLHRGHVTYLEKAKELGDYLIVGLNSDESVQKLKGQNRPLNSLMDRLQVIAALGSVDFVTWFETDTPRELIQTLKPHVLVKGGDWTKNQIVGSEEVLARGGRSIRSLILRDGVLRI
jgi:D-beta-D-heptose 7-phosphate kinase/D-beta-D-heptose 1-phosphate adenosyltransferase